MVGAYRYTGYTTEEQENMTNCERGLNFSSRNRVKKSLNYPVMCVDWVDFVPHPLGTATSQKNVCASRICHHQTWNNTLHKSDVGSHTPMLAMLGSLSQYYPQRSKHAL
jgi:hypothetical protein